MDDIVHNYLQQANHSLHDHDFDDEGNDCDNGDNIDCDGDGWGQRLK